MGKIDILTSCESDKSHHTENKLQNLNVMRSLLTSMNNITVTMTLGAHTP